MTEENEESKQSRSTHTYQSVVYNQPDDYKPFNDAMDHLHNIEGYPVKKPAKVGGLPLPIRLIGYFMAGFMVLLFVILVVFNFIF